MGVEGGLVELGFGGGGGGLKGLAAKSEEVPMADFSAGLTSSKAPIGGSQSSGPTGASTFDGGGGMPA